MTWNFEGNYYENCSCSAVCSCTSSNTALQRSLVARAVALHFIPSQVSRRGFSKPRARPSSGR